MRRAPTRVPLPTRVKWGPAIVLRCLDVAVFWALSITLAAAQSLTPSVLGSAIDLNSGKLIEYEIRPDGYAIWGDIAIGKATDIARDGLRLPQPL